MKKKIAVIGLKGLPSFGGAAAVGESIIYELKDIFDFTVYAISSHTEDNSKEINGFHQIVFKKFPIMKLNVIYYYLISALHTLFIGNYDVIHLHHTDISLILPLLRLKYKVIITSHGSIFNVKDITFKYSKLETLLLTISEKYFLRFASIITSVSKDLAKSLESRYNRKVHYIPNGISLPKDNSNYKFANSNALKKPYILFAAGRIIPTKGCHIMLEALKKIKYNDNVKIVGDVEQLDWYKKEIISLSKNLKIEFMGLIKDKNYLNQIIKKASLFIFPSSNETMSMMLLEVAAQKTPLICSDISENKAIFNDSEVMYFKTDDYIDLSEKITLALQNENEMNQHADRAYKRLIENYQWRDIAQQYEKLYNAIIP